MNSDDVLVLTAPEVRSLLTMDDCISAVELAFRFYGEGKAVSPAVLAMHVSEGGFHIKAGLLDLDKQYFGAKVNGNFPKNAPRFGLPTVQGLVILCDAEKGAPLAVMDSGEITSLRTGAATAVAARFLARQKSATLTVCGCGVQGRVQVKALSRVRNLRTVFTYDSNEEQSLRLAKAITAELAIPAQPVTDLRSAARQSDICVTCTPSRKPFLDVEDVSPGTFIAAVGADNPEKQEIHPTLLAKSKIIADILQQCAVMGDLHHGLAAGVVTERDVHAELGDVVAGKKAGRQSDREIIIFDSTGMALQDVAAAAWVYQKAQQQGAGTRFRFAD